MRIAQYEQIPGAIWSPLFYPLMQKNSHPTTGPRPPVIWLQPLPKKCFLITSCCTANGEGFKECISNRSPGILFPSIIYCSFSLSPPCLFSYKHPAQRSRSSFISQICKHLSTLDTVHLRVFFFSRGEKIAMRMSVLFRKVFQLSF